MFKLYLKKNYQIFKTFQSFQLSSSIIVEGNLVLTPNSKQPFEVKANNITIEGLSVSDYPLQKKKTLL